MSHSLHVDAHAAGAAGDGAHGGIEIPAVKSGIFILAMSSSCLREILPTLAVFGVALPFGMPSAFAISTDAGGVFMMNVKLRSLYTVITTGVGNPFSSDWVCALNALQNSMMFTPC
jgi:hypothetical protein